MKRIFRSILLVLLILLPVLALSEEPETITGYFTGRKLIWPGLIRTGDTVGAVEAYEPLELTFEEEHWGSMILENGKKGYVYYDGILPLPEYDPLPEKQMYSPVLLPVIGLPVTEAPAIAVLDSWTLCTVDGVSSLWNHVILPDGRSGYVPDGALKDPVFTLPENPVPLTVIRHCKSRRVSVMQDEDQIKLQRYLLSQKDSRSNAILLAMYIGPRLGEICALRWKNYDFEQGILHFEETVRRIAADEAADLPYGQRTNLVFSPVKTDSSDRELYLSEDLREIMRAQYDLFRKKFGRCPSQGDFIFFSNVGGVLDPDNLSSHFTRTLNQLGLPHVKFHALRHTFASRAVENGMAVSTLSGILGHADVTTTTHFYIHPREDAMRKATAGLGRICASAN